MYWIMDRADFSSYSVFSHAISYGWRRRESCIKSSSFRSFSHGINIIIKIFNQYRVLPHPTELTSDVHIVRNIAFLRFHPLVAWECSSCLSEIRVDTPPPPSATPLPLFHLARLYFTSYLLGGGNLATSRISSGVEMRRA